MSADDGYVVAKVYGEDNLYGIFHYFASDEDEPNFSREQADSLYSHPVAAILAAHRLEAEADWMTHTEYGVSITDAVLQDCKSYYTEEAWGVK